MQLAKHVLFAEAKRWHYVRIVGSVIIAIAGLLIAVLLPSGYTTVGVVGAFWALIARLILSQLEGVATRKAANVQEQFDCYLFDLPWNNILVGKRVSTEDILAAQSRFKGSESVHHNWYTDPGSGPYPIIVLICQRANLVWDARLRHGFAFAIAGVAAGWAAVLLLAAVIANLTVRDALVTLLVPSMGFFLLAEELIRGHWQLGQERLRIHEYVSDLWNALLVDWTRLTREDCRAIQDFMFLNRARGPFVPNRWYSWLRQRFEKNMIESTEQLKAELLKAGITLTP